MGKIIIRHADRVTEHALPHHSLVIGRDPECDLFFADKKLSRRHARLERAGDSVRIVDLGSRNGSWVNEERIMERVLESGDSLRLGSLHVELELDLPKASKTEREELDELELEGAEDSATVILPAGEPSATDEGGATVVLSRLRFRLSPIPKIPAPSSCPRADRLPRPRRTARR